MIVIHPKGFRLACRRVIGGKGTVWTGLVELVAMLLARWRRSMCVDRLGSGLKTAKTVTQHGEQEIEDKSMNVELYRLLSADLLSGAGSQDPVASSGDGRRQGEGYTSIAENSIRSNPRSQPTHTSGYIFWT